MKRYLKGLTLLLAGLGLFVACKDDDGIAVPQWDAAENYANIYFKGTSESHEFAPTDECKVTLKVFRRDTIGALTVNLEPTINTDSVFTVAPAVFEDRDSVAYFDVTFPNAEIGKTYTLQLTSTDPQLVSSWSKGIVYNLDVIRVKWNYLGKGTIWDWFPNTFNGNTGQLDIYVRDDDNTKFRLNNIFEDIAANAGVELNGDQTTEAYLSILRVGDVYNGVTVTKKDQISYDDLHTGVVNATYGAEQYYVHPVWFSSLHAESNWSYNRVLDYQDNGLPARVQLAPLYYMDGVGGYNYSQYDDDVIITFPGVYVPYTAVFDDDFEWSDVKTFDLTNMLTGESSNVMLQQATCTVDTDDCDSVFLATYGVPYRIKDAYAEGYDIVFFKKGEKIYVPDDIWYDLQETGVTEGSLTATKLYAYIDSEGSSMVVTEDGDIQSVTLNVSFTNEDGDIVFGEGEQTLANITWSKIATGTFYYNFFTSNEDETPEADPGYELLKRDDKDDQFQIAEWLFGEDGFYFTWDQSTNECVVKEQPTYYQHPSYGMVYIIEGALYHSNYAGNTSYYDPETKTFHFFPVYFVSAGSFGQFEEVFEITEEGAVKHQASFKLNKGSLNSSLRRSAHTWTGLKGLSLNEPINTKVRLQSIWEKLKN